MDPFRMIPALELGKGEKVTSAVVLASAVFVGTDSGFIVKCSIPKPSEDDTEVKGEAKFRVQLASKKPIQTLTIIESISLIAALSDGCVYLLPLSLAASGYILAKGLTSLCVTEAGLLGGSPEVYVGRIGGGIGVYVQRGVDFGLLKDLNVGTNKEVKLLKYLRNKLLVATNQEYFLLEPETGAGQELFSFGSRDTPTILSLNSEEVLLTGQGGLAIRFNLDTLLPSQKNTFMLPQDLLAAAVSEPYLMSFGASGKVALYNLSSQSASSLLSLPLAAPVSFATTFAPQDEEVTERNVVLVAAANNLHLILPVPFKHHLQKLLLAGRVADALDQLNANFPLKDPQRSDALKRFHLLAGWSRFASLNFSVAFQHFAHAPVDLGHLLGFWRLLWPSWLRLPLTEETEKLLSTTPKALFPPPQDLQDFVAGVLAAGEKNPAETGAQATAKQQVLIELASGALCTFLLKQRQLLLSDYNGFCQFNISSSSSSGVDAAVAVAAAAPPDRRQQQLLLLKTIDTILIKLLVEADDARWQQLLLPQQQQQQQFLGCTCSVEDCRLFLLSLHRTDALAALLHNSGRTSEALELLAQQQKDSANCPPRTATALAPADQMLQLLQHVLQQQQPKQQQQQEQNEEGEQQQHAAALLRRFAPLVLPANPKKTLELFMQKGFCPLPPIEVLQLLQQQPHQQQQELREMFLEHLLLQGLLQDPKIETELAVVYLERTLAAAKEAATKEAAAAAAAATAAAAAAAAAATAAATEQRQRLRRVLQQQCSYDVHALLEKAEGFDLVEEKAILYGKAGEHEQALLCFVKERQDVAAAETYCAAAERQLLPLLQQLQPTEYAQMQQTGKLWTLPIAKAQQQQQQQQQRQRQQQQQGYRGTRRTCGLLLLLLKVLLNCWREASDAAAAAQPAEGAADAAAKAAAEAEPVAAAAAGGGAAAAGAAAEAESVAAAARQAADFYLNNALLLLQRHSGDPSLSLRAVFALLPGGLLLQQLAPFIRVSLQQQQDAAATAAIHEKLCSAEYLTVYGQAAEEKSKWIEITQETACPTCARRIGNRPFVADPQGRCFHTQCADHLETFTASPPNVGGSSPSK